MKSPDFPEGVAVAAALAIIASICTTVFAPLIGALAITRLLVPALALAYLLYLFSRSRERSGRLVVLAAWGCIAVLAAWLAPPLALYLMIHTGALWLVRSLYFHSGLLPSLLDMALGAFSVIALSWALSRTGSALLGCWCFFLVQALFVAIPRSLTSNPATTPLDDGFQHAYTAAQAALAQLIRQSTSPRRTS
ncbi:MAG: hypothetical protein KBG75_11195 [Pseudomonadales bacterium]|nr:hypothetical protein [Pseudomonadales bacterium]